MRRRGRARAAVAVDAPVATDNMFAPLDVEDVDEAPAVVAAPTRVAGRQAGAPVVTGPVHLETMRHVFTSCD